MLRSKAPELHQRIHRRVIRALGKRCNLIRACQHTQRLVVFTAAARVELCNLAVYILRRKLRVEPCNFALGSLHRRIGVCTVCRELHNRVHGKKLGRRFFCAAAAQQRQQRRKQQPPENFPCFCHTCTLSSIRPNFFLSRNGWKKLLFAFTPLAY